MKKRKSTSHFLQVTWDQVATKIAELNPEFAQIVNEISPGPEYRLYLARYDYGDLIMKDGRFYIRDEEQTLPLGDADLPSQINDDLDYNLGGNPTCIVLKNQLELFLEHKFFDIPISFGMYTAGRVFSTSYVLGSQHTPHLAFNWNLSAGARSIFLLPKITNQRSFKRLRKHFSLTSDTPYSYIDQWKLFKEINHAANLDWSLDALYFSKHWFANLKDPAWIKFHNYLLESFHQSYEFWTFKVMWDMAFSLILKRLSIKTSPYITNTVKQLIFMAAGNIYGMGPGINNLSAPIEKLQDIFVDVYGLNKYTPTFMLPTRFDLYGKSQPVYYSFQYPNLMETTLRPRLYDSVSSDMYEAYTLLQKCLQQLQDDDLNLSGSMPFDMANKVHFDAFHNSTETHSFIFSNTSTMPKKDRNLISTINPKIKNNSFAENASFVRGCIRVSHKT